MSEPFVAEIRIFAGSFAPKGWALCNGQLLPISQNTALFSLLGTQYGGNGTTNFALPNHNLTPGLLDDGSPNPAAYDSNGQLLPLGRISQTPDVAQTNPGLGGGGPRVVQLGLKVVF